jgi:fluoride ion exporter CrcB/FEX
MSAFTNNSLEMMLATKYLQAFTYSLIMLVICLSANIIGYAFIKKLIL